MAGSAQAKPGSRIAVVGAGLAGLNAAYQLRKLGYDATVYEARNRVGGRVHSVTAGPGYVLDRGGSFVNTDHDDVLALIDEFGLELFDRLADAASVPFPEIAYYFDGREISEPEMADALRDLAEQITADAARLDDNYSKWARRFDRLSVADYLDQHADKIGASFARELVECAIRTEYGVEPDESSALQLLFLLPTVEGQSVEVLGYSDEAFVVEGGSGRVPEELAGALGDQVRLGRQLVRFEERPQFHRLTFSDGSVVEADWTVITLPVSLLRTIQWDVTFPSKFRRYIAEVDLGRNEKTFAGFDPKVWRSPDGFVNGVWTDQGYSAAWDGTQRQDERTDGALTFFFGGDEVDNRPSARQLVNRFDRVVDGAQEAYTGFSLKTNWARDPFTRGAYVNFRPGQLTTFGKFFWIEDESSVAFRNLVFAGEHFSDLWYGFMNGAAETGRLAAGYVAERIK
ncbi:NAD(P)/FAD-dependent oxidoreductase [soil metagenome]